MNNENTLVQNVIGILTKEYKTLDRMLSEMDHDVGGYDYCLGERNGLLLAIGLLENKPIN